LEKFVRGRENRRPGEGDHRYVDGRRRFRALSRSATMMKVPIGAFEHPGLSFNKFLNSLWPTEQAFADFSSLLRHVRSQSRARSAVRTEPNSEIQTVIIDGSEDYLCSHCRSLPAYVDKKRKKVVPGRRVCNMKDKDCLLRKKAEREEKRSPSVHRSNAQRLPRGRGRR
jgi:hypothetical protein